MTEEEKKAAAEQKQREMEEMMRQAQESYRQEYASMPYVFVAQTALHQGEGVADGGVAGAHIQPVPVADR